MPDHDPALVDKVARALYEDTCRQSKDDPEDWTDDAAFDLYGDDVRDFWRQQARAALDAMPAQPEPIVTDKIRETIGLWTGTYGWAATSPVGDLIRDLRAILDTALEPR